MVTVVTVVWETGLCSHPSSRWDIVCVCVWGVCEVCVCVCVCGGGVYVCVWGCVCVCVGGGGASCWCQTQVAGLDQTSSLVISHWFLVIRECGPDLGMALKPHGPLYGPPCGPPMWSSYVVFLCGPPMWSSYVVLLYGPPMWSSIWSSMWSSYVVLLCGPPCGPLWSGW